jgi:hypothetical protein
VFLNNLLRKLNLIIVVFLLNTLSGCLVIPLNKEIHSQEVLGQRVNKQGEIEEEILKIKIRKNLHAVFGPDGPGDTYLIFTEYHIKRDQITKKLSHMDFFWDKNSYEIKPPVLPVLNSKKWIAIKPDDIKSQDVSDIYLIIFDKDKIYKKAKINNCFRVLPGTRNESYAVEFKNGNTKAIIHTENGDYLLNVINDTFEKINTD